MVGSSTGRRGLDQPDHVHRLLRRLLGPHLLPLPHRGRQEAGRKDQGVPLRTWPTHHPGVNFINILLKPFLYKSALRSFFLITVWLCNFLAQEYQLKSCS